ncbi:MAG TPA: ABC transporter permease [Anaerolineales bacterium]|jgi:ABC-2 type transport system permease protein
MRNVWTIASREFRLYFISPLAYAIAASVFLILGGIFFINIYFGVQSGNISPDGRMVMGPLVTIMVFATPALTMRLLADEQRMGTLELLLTAPVRDWELVVGKWLGSLGFMTALLAVTWVYPLIMHQMADPGIDQGLLVSAYLGLFLLTACMLALGVLVSSLFDNPLPAFFATLGLLLGLWILGGLGSGSGAWSELAGYLGLVDHFYNNLYRGILSLTDILYYVSMTILALFVGAQAIQARRWR